MIVRTRRNGANVVQTSSNAAHVGISSCEASSVDGAWVVQGPWDGSTNVLPSASVLKGYQYLNTSNSTTLLMPDGGIIPAGAIIVAKVDNPGQTVTNWLFLLSVI